MERIGNYVGMNYGADGSGADTNYAVQRIFRDRGMRVNKNKASIKNALNYNRGIVTIEFWTREKNIWGRKRGKGHTYIADGYLQYSNGSDLIHVNYGWGHSNGYYLTNLMSPHWTSNAPEQFPHAWEFYCIY